MAAKVPMQLVMEPLQTFFVLIALVLVPGLVLAAGLVLRWAPSPRPPLEPFRPAGRALSRLLLGMGVTHVLVGAWLGIVIEAPGAWLGGVLIAATGGFWAMCAYAEPIARSMTALSVPRRFTSSSSSE